MTTSTINHRRASRAAAVTALVGTLWALTLSSASAMPVPGDRPAVSGRTVHSHGHYIWHACFITPHTWNEALEGPLPRCYIHIP